MKQPPKKQHWLDRAIDVHNFHIGQCKVEPYWVISDTAKSLNRSIGSVSQDITLASWAKTHEKQLRKFSSMKDALAWVKDKHREMRFQEI